MENKHYRYLYGPVASWRLGSSLGLDPISAGEKICTFDCVYCQLGKTKVFSDERRVFVPSEAVVREIEMLPPVSVDYITFSGAGEPTLAQNLGELIRAVKKIRKEKVAVITNSSLIDRPGVREDLSGADFVLAKLDACSADLFQRINRPVQGVLFDTVLQALKDFRRIYKGRLALQIMFVSANEKYAEGMAELAKEIRPDEVQLNTPLRPCGIRPLSEAAMRRTESCFRKVLGAKFPILNVFKEPTKPVAAISSADTLKRRGKFLTEASES